MNRPTRFYSNRQEQAVAKVVQGRQVANSGATAFNKGDIQADDWLLECKTCTTEKQSMSVKKEWLTKNREEAIAMRKHHHAVCFDFGDAERYYILTERMFIEYMKLLKQEEEIQ